MSILIKGMEMPKQNQSSYVELRVYCDGHVERRKGLAGPYERLIEKAIGIPERQAEWLMRKYDQSCPVYVPEERNE